MAKKAVKRSRTAAAIGAEIPVPESATVPVIMPGELFPVEYGNGETVEVLALSIRGQRKLAGMLKDMAECEESGDALKLFDVCEEALTFAVGDPSEEFMESVDAQLAMSIIRNCLNKQGVSEDDAKK